MGGWEIQVLLNNAGRERSRGGPVTEAVKRAELHIWHCQNTLLVAGGAASR